MERATNACGSQMRKLKDHIYRAGYEHGLNMAAVPDDSELFNKTIICPPGVLTRFNPMLIKGMTMIKRGKRMIMRVVMVMVMVVINSKAESFYIFLRFYLFPVINWALKPLHCNKNSIILTKWSFLIFSFLYDYL